MEGAASITVELGRLVEASTADAAGMERLAFGEFIGPRGELASYALGWRTDADPRVGRLTVGIGAGNPGGGSFHAVVFDNEDSYAFQLVDDPFEDVPQGGADLTADAAREHPDLPFIWAVADEVFSRDPRAWWLVHWLRETQSITTPEVFEREEPVLLVVNDADDELWQLIGTTDAGDEAKVGHLYHAIDEDPTLQEVLDLLPGEEAVREQVGGPWTRRRSPRPDQDSNLGPTP